MDFEYTPEQIHLRKAVREFAEAEIAPHVMEWDEAQTFPREVIRKLHGVDSTHVESVPIKETFRGETVSDGVVEVFDLIGHPNSKRIYGWSHQTDKPEQPWRHVAVLHGDGITSPCWPLERQSYRS